MPCMSVIVTMVLLNVARMLAMPVWMFLPRLALTIFLTTAFSPRSSASVGAPEGRGVRLLGRLGCDRFRSFDGRSSGRRRGLRPARPVWPPPPPRGLVQSRGSVRRGFGFLVIRMRFLFFFSHRKFLVVPGFAFGFAARRRSCAGPYESGRWSKCAARGRAIHACDGCRDNN